MSEAQEQDLEREIGPLMLAVYGAGTILGAGIYVLIGKVAGEAGYWLPLAFVVAAVAAGINGMAYAELATRQPRAGGPVAYVHSAFDIGWLTNLLGWMIVTTGVVSAATIASGFSGYIGHFVEVTDWLPEVLLLVAISNVALIRLERRNPEAPFDIPRFVPWIGLVVSLALIVGRLIIQGGGH